MNGLDVGIDQLGVYLPRYALPLDRLAEARGVPVEKIHVGLGAHAMAVVPPWEDAVTLGANAAARVFRQGEVRPDEIGLLVVATETAVDHAKPIGIFLHDLLGLPPSCRTFEVKHACYGGTAGIMLAADWIRSGAARGRKALVVATDIARYDVGSSAEFTQGAGAAAVVVERGAAAPPHGSDDRVVRAQRLRLLAAARPARGAGRRQVLARLLSRRAARRGGRLPLGAERSRAAGRCSSASRRSSTTRRSRRWRTRRTGGWWRTNRRRLTPAAVGERFERSWSTQAEPALGLARAGGQHLHGVALPLPRVARSSARGRRSRAASWRSSPTARAAARSSSPRGRCPAARRAPRASGRRHSSRRAAC